MEKSLYLFSFLVLLIMASCTRDEFDLNNSKGYNDELFSRSAGSGYDAFACSVNDKMGILCQRTVGSTCKKEKSCESVMMLGGEDYFTPQELNDFLNVDFKQNRPFMIHMWEIGVFNHPDSIQ